MDIQHATALGRELQELLHESGAVAQSILAGSIRRGAPFVKDIEIVVQPLDDGGSPGLALERWLEGAVDDPDTPLVKDTAVKRWGPKYKKLLYKGQKLDLFIVTPPAQWGAILAIRTGPAEFSKALVTSRKWGGVLPPGLKQSEGRLVAVGKAGDRPIETPSEEEYFHALGLPWIEPRERTLAELARHVEGIGR